MPPRAKCTFYSCNEYDLEQTREFPEKRTSEETAHFNRSHSDAPFVFLCKFTQKRISTRRDQAAQMMYRCICNSTLVTQSSVKRHYESCHIAQTFVANGPSQQIQGSSLFRVQQKETPLTELLEESNLSDSSDEASDSRDTAKHESSRATLRFQPYPRHESVVPFQKSPSFMTSTPNMMPTQQSPVPVVSPLPSPILPPRSLFASFSPSPSSRKSKKSQHTKTSKKEAKQLAMVSHDRMDHRTAEAEFALSPKSKKHHVKKMMMQMASLSHERIDNLTEKQLSSKAKINRLADEQLSSTAKINRLTDEVQQLSSTVRSLIKQLHDSQAWAIHQLNKEGQPMAADDAQEERAYSVQDATPEPR